MYGTKILYQTLQTIKKCFDIAPLGLIFLCVK